MRWWQSFNGHFPAQVCWYQDVFILNFIEAKDDGAGGDNWNYKTCKALANRHHRQINTQLFYRPDALPVAQPTVSEHWRKSTRGVQKVCSLPQLTTAYGHHSWSYVMNSLLQLICTWTSNSPKHGFDCRKRNCSCFSIQPFATHTTSSSSVSLRPLKNSFWLENKWKSLGIRC